jgi:chromatin modification-related protein YNG2
VIYLFNMDAASVLEQYVSDLDNLPAELAHILEEIRDKDLKFYETRKRIQQRDNQIHKFIKANGSLAENPKEAPTYPKIRADFEKAMLLQQQKCDLSNTGLYIISRHVKRLNDEVRKLENDGLLAPSGNNSSYSVEPSSRQSSVPVSASRTRPSSAIGVSGGLSIAGERKTTPNGPSSRAGTPSLSRPPKRMKLNGDKGPQIYVRPNGSSGHHTNGDEEEVLYCMCQEVSFGNMVACDNPDCQYEWFHYDCVGLTEPPNGTWYCPMCSKDRKDNGDFKDVARRKR